MRSYDEIFKELFKDKIILQDFLINFIGEKWVYEIDFDSIEPYPTEFISRSFKKRFCDLIYRVKIKNIETYIIILIEFQSKDNRYMPLRLLTYICLFLEDLIKRRKKLKQNISSDSVYLPPIFPVVFYNGERPWRYPTNISSLFFSLPETFINIKKYIPNFEFLLVDTANISDTELTSKEQSILANMFCAERYGNIQKSLEYFGKALKYIKTNEHLLSIATTWLIMLIENKGYSEAEIAEIVNNVNEVGVDLEMLNSRLIKARNEIRLEGMELGKLEGMEIGKLEGEAESLIKQLKFKFGSIDSLTESKIKQANNDQLDRWLLKILTINELSQLFEE